MSKEVFSSLKTTVKDTALLFAAMALSQALWFLIRILIVRNVSQADFGIYSLALTILSIATVLFTVGAAEGIARYISILRDETSDVKRKGIIKSAFQIVFFTGILSTAGMYVLSDLLSTDVFDMPALAPVLKVIAFAVILSIALDTLTALFRGYGIMRTKAFADVAQPTLYAAILSLVFIGGLPFIGVIYSFVTALGFVVAGLLVYAFKKTDLREILFNKRETFRKELIYFSVPLLGVSIGAFVAAWTDTLMLGYFMEAKHVGLYNVAISLAKLLIFPIGIVNFVFMPIAGALYSKGLGEDLKRTYQVLTKWLFSASFPAFLVLFLFPEMTLTFLFGQEYVGASIALSILSLGFMLTATLGMNRLVLVVMGKPAIIMWTVAVGAALNIVLNYILIPLYGLDGAAIATMTSTVISLAFATAVLYSHSGIHPFTSGYLKPSVASSVIAAIIYVVAKQLPLYWWMMPIYLLLFIGGYMLSILLTRSIEKEDIFIFDLIADKLGLQLTPVRELLKRFAHE